MVVIMGQKHFSEGAFCTTNVFDSSKSAEATPPACFCIEGHCVAVCDPARLGIDPLLSKSRASIANTNTNTDYF